MSDETPDRPKTPGSGAGDAARTTQVPRLSREDAAAKTASTTDKGRPRAVAVEDKAPAKKATARNSSATARNGAATKDDAKDAKDAAKTSEPAEKTEPSTEPKNGSSVKLGGGANGSSRGGTTTSTSRPLTAGDYMKTTGTSPESTSVIPAVKDAPSSPPRVEPEPEESGGRHASLRLSYIDPWSVTKLAFAISVALMIVAVVATTIFWLVLEATGVWGQINGSVNSVLSDDDSAFNITDYLGFGRLVGLTLVLSAINVIVMTALATVAAHLYNLGSQLLGGVEVTFAERD